MTENFDASSNKSRKLRRNLTEVQDPAVIYSGDCQTLSQRAREHLSAEQSLRGQKSSASLCFHCFLLIDIIYPMT